jgi:hypothetical protein
LVMFAADSQPLRALLSVSFHASFLLSPKSGPDQVADHVTPKRDRL